MFQVSLRTLLLLVALVALAIVSLRFASETWRSVVSAMAAIAFCAAAILAIVDRGERQAFAIGFVVAMACYGLVLHETPRENQFASAGEHPEFNPDLGRLPTTRLLRPLFHALAEVTWSKFDGRKWTVAEGAEAKLAATGMGNYSMNETPSRHTFMTIGHIWWAILLGLVGGWFARWVHLRRSREPLAAPRS